MCHRGNYKVIWTQWKSAREIMWDKKKLQVKENANFGNEIKVTVHTYQFEEAKTTQQIKLNK